MGTFRASFWRWDGEQFIKIILHNGTQSNCFIFNIATQDIQSVQDSDLLYDKKVMDTVLKCVRWFINHSELVHDVWTDIITI